jgi:alkylation response protein AidB-like acyl-CoA dehydrogenase
MQLVLNEDQELLAKTAADFVRERSLITRVRELRDRGDETGFSRALWKQMAELGWVGIPFPEALGGAAMGMADLAVVLEQLGRRLAPEPFLSTVLLGGQALLLGASEAQRQAWLPGVCAGERLLTLAWQERASRFDPFRIEAWAEPSGDAFTLTGEKIQVLDAAVADAIVVAARSGGGPREEAGITLFLVPRGTAGVAIERQTRIDHRGAGLVRLDGVRVGKVPIGSFQGLKHRAARVFMEIELARSATLAAVRAIDGEAAQPPAHREDAEAAKLVSLAKARCSDAFVLAANEGVQMFGGVGMTDEYDLGFYMKRARVAEMTFGDAAWHRERWARLGGY